MAEAADWPVNECDLEARHQWLVTEGKTKLEALLTDPRQYDAEIAGWWVWGQSSWIGQGWCSGDGPWAAGPNGWVKGEPGSGVRRIKPAISGGANKGIQRKIFESRSDRGLRRENGGINRNLPNISGQGVNRTGDGSPLCEYLRRLAARLRNVRVACGEWDRILSPSVTYYNGVTGVLLDPPYGEGNMEYASGGNDSRDLPAKVREWAVENGKDDRLRIALCGYEGQHEMPDDWVVAEWTSRGGYGLQGEDGSEARENRYRERIWFSPACRPQAARGFLIPPVYRNPKR